MTYVEAESLRKKFYEAINNTTINTGNYIIPVNNNPEKNVVIKLIILDENNYPINVTKVFSNIQELDLFIETLTNLKIIAKSDKHTVEIIPEKENDIKIYINEKEVDTTTIQNIVNQLKIKKLNNIQRTIFDIECLNKQLVYLNQQLNNAQTNLNMAENLILAVKNTKDKDKQIKYIKEHTPIKLTTSISEKEYEFLIDVTLPIELFKKYNNEESKEEIIEIMNEFLKDIQNAIIERKKIVTNFLDIYDTLSMEEIMLIEEFLEQLRDKMIKFRAVTQNNLEIKQKVMNLQVSSINNAIEQKKDMVETITDMKILNTQSESYSFTSNNPIIEEKYVTYNNGAFTKETSLEDEVFADIQLQQIQKLTPEERNALMYYKLFLRNPINTVIAFIRKNGMSLKDIGANQETLQYVFNLIGQCYDEFTNNVKESKDIFTSKLKKLHTLSNSDKVIERLFSKYPEQIPNKKEYIELVITSIPLIESALSKITTLKEIILYRSSSKNNLIEDGRFLSTSISLSSAKSFTSDKDKVVFPNIFKITIPAGSHVIAYTDDLYTDNYDENYIFNEVEHEILIDPKHFHFKQTYSNSQKVSNDIISTRVEYQASPREILFTDDITSTFKS